MYANKRETISESSSSGCHFCENGNQILDQVENDRKVYNASWSDL